MIEIIDMASLHGPVLVEGDTRNAITWALGKVSQLRHLFYVLNINGYLAIKCTFLLCAKGEYKEVDKLAK